MNKQQKQLKKKKERAEKNKAKTLRRHAAISKQNQIERKDYLIHKAMQKNRRQLAKMETIADEILDKLPPETRKQIENNIEILKALEDEYVRETGERQVLNTKLEEAGCLTLEDKMTHMQELLKAKQQAEGIDIPVNVEDDVTTPSPAWEDDGHSCTGECAH